MSFSDLMSALLLVFILAVVVLVLQLMQKQDELEGQREAFADQQTEFTNQIGTLQEAELVREQILSEIQAELAGHGIAVRISENNTVLSIPSELLGFDSGAYVIKPEYQHVATTIGSVIASVVSKDDRSRYLDTVFVEGHTDIEAFNGLDGMGNWGLSTFRAISLWQHWGAALPAGSNPALLVASDGRSLFSVSGYGETRPATATQATEAERALNRRIDIRFTIVRPSAQDLIDIQEQFEGSLER
ncbi:OmpA family protein [Salinibacterium sp. SYSU T00001]|uniref:OmpA/MotB family protein n=1 Tax=Homoserinimonas sedimenticola TaxID=2986805 RepID=UPI002236B174|nr:OmpA family protein [Salinibacterium sedimenticola]MCW4386320.1 OmpA family protein [Salinibacterium sedimenticola]